MTAGQPIRKTPTCSGRRAVQGFMCQGLGLMTTTDCTAAAAFIRTLGLDVAVEVELATDKHSRIEAQIVAHNT